MKRPLKYKKTLLISLGVTLLIATGITLKLAPNPTARLVLKLAIEVPAAMWLKYRVEQPSLPWSCEPSETRIRCYQSLVHFWLPEKTTSTTAKTVVLAAGLMILEREKAQKKSPVEEINYDLASFLMDIYEGEISNPASERADSFFDKFSDPNEVQTGRKFLISEQKKFTTNLDDLIEGRLKKMDRTIASEPKTRAGELRRRYSSFEPLRKRILAQEGLSAAEEAAMQKDAETPAAE